MEDKVKFIRLGNCNKCGDCCRVELLPSRIKMYEKVGLPYKLINQNCDKFDPETGLCKDYNNRPKSCRDFPTMPVDLLALPRCSYSFLIIKGKIMTLNDELPQNRWCPYCFNIVRIEIWEDWFNHLETIHDLVVRREGETYEEAIARVKAKNPRIGTENCQCPRCVIRRQLETKLIGA